MSIGNFICQACGDDLAQLEDTAEGPQLIFASGLTLRPDGSAACPACGEESGVNFGGLQAGAADAARTR